MNKSSFEIIYLQCPKHVLDLVLFQKDDEFVWLPRRKRVNYYRICEIKVDENQYQIQKSKLLIDIGMLKCSMIKIKSVLLKKEISGKVM